MKILDVQASSTIVLALLGLFGVEAIQADVVAVQPLPSRIEGLHRLGSAVQQPLAEPVSANDDQRKPQPIAHPRVTKSGPTRIESTAESQQEPVAAPLADFWKRLEHIKDAAELRGLVVDAGNTILEQQDGRAAEVLGWRYLAEHMPSEAEVWFQRAVRWLPSASEAQYGQALALFGQDRLEEAYELCSILPQEPAHALALDLRAQLGKREYDRARYPAAIAWLNHPESTTEQRALLAWAKFKGGKVDEARRDFEDLYHRSPSTAAAQAWATALAATHNIEALRSWAMGDDPFLRTAASAYLADQFEGRGLLLAATDLKTRADLATKDTLTTMTVGAGMRQRAGAAGVDRLTTIETPLLAVDRSMGHRIWGLQLAALDLNSGKAAANALLGSARGFADQISGHEQGLLDWRVSYRDEGWNTLRVSLGSTPMGAALSPRLVGEVQGQFQLDDGQWRLGLFARPQRDSLLSYTGLYDPSSGQRWGRVVANGFEASIDHKLGSASAPDANTWWFHGEGRAMRLTGSGVANNDAFEASAGIQRTWKLEELGQISNGPRLVWRQFSNNQNHFTLGNGGYFSPQSYLAVGDALQFLSAEGRRWIVKTEAEGLLASQREAATSCFAGATTLTSSLCSNYASSTQTGLSGRVQLAAAWLMTPTQQLGLTLEARRSLNYRDTAVMLTWTLLPQARSGLKASDLISNFAQSLW